ncbi:O-methyltransferase [Clostridium cellulovorans]|uniref:tRNA 5-hydroxyuridine methyltransferase n=1 Tax=Clostridium cellulovorans (strain ATCC 35296 / DSM 3052 / OCM 3 / 743B) TaxID=573061 RepID=D9SL66_CLOC7|nr:O-methyltransferase [Clostridium cellulovorans]ADL51582.1 O-methyltransferase family 3 [Clostridium cellulovorans 743B]
MNGITFDYMEEYLRNLIPENQGLLGELEEYAKENRVPIAQKETINFLRTMIAIKKPKRVLELGTAIGYSAITIAQTFPCEVTTVERNPEMVELAKKYIEEAKLQDKIKVEVGDCMDILEKLQEPFDLIFMDAGKGHYNHFLPHCLRLLNRDGIIIADNVLFRGMVANDQLVSKRKITIVKRMRKYLDIVSKDPNLYTSVIPMGDGIAVTTRRE